MMAHIITPVTAFSAEPFVADIPGSKSLTNRALILAAQRLGRTEIRRALHCEDTDFLAACLNQFGGLSVQKTSDGFLVERTSETLTAPTEPLYVGGAGTPARFLLSFASMAKGETTVTGNARLSERPMGHLLQTFGNIGVRFECLKSQDCLPIKVHGSHITLPTWWVNGTTSSQFTSSLLLLAAQQAEADGPITVVVEGSAVSRPYVEMTIRMMEDCGIRFARPLPYSFVVYPGKPQNSVIDIEADASGMSYFLAAAAVTGTKVVIPNIGSGSAQGDVGFAKILQQMGCDLAINTDSIELRGGDLRGVDVDMDEMPDTVLTLAAVAALVQGQTRVTNIANLRVKECDRIHAAATELQRLGVDAEQGPDYLIVRPSGIIKPATIETYNDHRVAMCFAIPGLLHSGIDIINPECVAKSFPGFWAELSRFQQHHQAAAAVSAVA
jgi:3-phosphoshikimate 1-carboxyvinyltransferase